MNGVDSSGKYYNPIMVNDWGDPHLNGQQLAPYASIPYGNSTIGDAGCEALSCYNMLIDLGMFEPLSNVVSYFSNRFLTVPFSGFGKGGKWGASPTDIESFLVSRKINYQRLTNLQMSLFDKCGPVAGIYILSYMNEDPFHNGMHTIEVVCDGEKYTAYNWKVNRRGSTEKGSIYEFIPDIVLGCPVVVSVFYIPNET